MPDSATVSPTPTEPQGERRRRQFIEIAQVLIVEEGIDAVRVPRVAELAGCGRTLFYRYFPRREDLLMAVMSDFYEQLDGLSEELIDAGIRGFVESEGTGLPESSRNLTTLLWDGLDMTSHAGLILRSSPDMSHELKEHAKTFRERYDSRWHKPLCAIGLSELAAEVAMEAGLALLSTLYTRVRAGEAGRAEAIDLWMRALAVVTRGLRSPQ